MPNHVVNIVTFECSEEKLKEIMEAIQYDDGPDDQKGTGTIDFNKVIPMPDNIFKGNLGPKEREMYGKNNWYDWSIKNWGTKWNSYNSTKEDDKLCFQTAWSSPHPVIKKLSEMFPDVSINHKWADEDIGQNCGEREYFNGEEISCKFPENDKEALEFAMETWGYDMEDFNIALNLSENDYIRTDIEEYDVIELLGKKVLFTEGRLTENDVAKGFYLYHFRGDNANEPATLEATVQVNHAGSIISKDPFDLGEQGYISLDADSIDYCDESMTMQDYKDFGYDIGEDGGIKLW